MWEYEYSALVDVHGWSEVPRGRPLFESILIPQNWLGDVMFENFADDLEIGEVNALEGETGYPLVVFVVPGMPMLLTATFERSRFEEAAIARMLGHWRALFEGMAANPDGSHPGASVVDQRRAAKARRVERDGARLFARERFSPSCRGAGGAGMPERWRSSVAASA